MNNLNCLFFLFPIYIFYIIYCFKFSTCSNVIINNTKFLFNNGNYETEKYFLKKNKLNEENNEETENDGNNDEVLLHENLLDEENNPLGNVIFFFNNLEKKHINKIEHNGEKKKKKKKKKIVNHSSSLEDDRYKHFYKYGVSELSNNNIDDNNYFYSIHNMFNMNNNGNNKDDSSDGSYVSDGDGGCDRSNNGDGRDGRDGGDGDVDGGGDGGVDGGGDGGVDGGGDGGNGEQQNERKRLFNIAIELKNGSTNKKQNIQKSIKLFEFLVLNKTDKITAKSYYELGKIYFYGFKRFLFGYKRDINLSLYYLNKAAELKNAGALHFLSFIYFYQFNKTDFDKKDYKDKEEISNMTGSEEDNITNNDKKKEKKKEKNKEKNKPNELKLYYLKKSLEFEIKATLLKYTPSILTMAYKYLYGINIKPKCNIAKEYYKSIAERVMNSDYINIPLSEFDILNKENINIHNEINNLKNSEEEILEFLNEQIKGGDVMSLYDLGKKYKEEKNFTKALEYLNEASEKNNLLAKKELAIIYLYGYGTQKDIKKSIENFTQAADAGDVESKCYLGYIYYFIDDYKNLKLSLKYLIEAAKHDYGEAFFFLAEIILDISIKKKYISDYVYKIVFKLYEQSADLGYIQAYFREAQLYEIGKGVEESCLNATLSYKFVAESTLWTNKIRQGMQYYIEKDYLKAFYTYALAAYEGYEIAQNNLIYIYKNNKLHYLIEPNKIMQLLNLLYNQGNYRALYEMGQIYNKQKKENLAISCYKLGLRKGDLRNLLPLSKYYEKNKENARALKFVNYFIKQKKRERESSNTKIEKIKSALESSLLYFRKYKLFLKNLFNVKQENKNS
ncbi:ubiquitin-protein ligase, putative [Hepatocystis sp. ex Piliocolobus tephrosceles]|nr:ubiquitin-protein ligase, putative [Hepatocystis sp. ex Piliocolobus tephrosceles]